jgi:hypothetical protein
LIEIDVKPTVVVQIQFFVLGLCQQQYSGPLFKCGELVAAVAEVADLPAEELAFRAAAVHLCNLLLR